MELEQSEFSVSVNRERDESFEKKIKIKRINGVLDAYVCMYV